MDESPISWWPRVRNTWVTLTKPRIACAATKNLLRATKICSTRPQSKPFHIPARCSSCLRIRSRTGRPRLRCSDTNHSRDSAGDPNTGSPGKSSCSADSLAVCALRRSHTVLLLKYGAIVSGCCTGGLCPGRSAVDYADHRGQEPDWQAGRERERYRQV